MPFDSAHLYLHARLHFLSLPGQVMGKNGLRIQERVLNGMTHSANMEAVHFGPSLATNSNYGLETIEGGK